MRKREEVEVKRHALTSALCGVFGQLHDPVHLPTWKGSPVSTDQKTGRAPEPS